MKLGPRDIWRRITATQLLALSFLALIALGTLGFMTLPGLYVGAPLSFLDALFTATSAVCVTGLIVVDTATYFTRLGQAYVLLLIQLGGLGIVTMSTLIIVALGRRLSIRQESASGVGTTHLTPLIDYRSLTRSIVRFTFGFEAVGALLLFALWVPRFGVGDGAWHAIFHAVSAFCNAGFSTFSDSLTGFQESALTLLLVCALIIAGGIGFLTLEELSLLQRERRARRASGDTRGARYRLTLHSRLALSATAFLILFGWAVLGALEWDLSLGHLGEFDRVINSLFMSVTPRTAGFNNIDYRDASDASSLFTMLLMFVGGSPGSAAGGLKTTTVALLVVLAWSRFRGSPNVSAFGRTVPDETVQRATGLFVLALGMLMLWMFALILSELGNLTHSETGGAYVAYVFEAVSAMNTVGLSLGVTPELSPTSKGLVILLMYLGRIGPLTLAAALALPRRRGVFRYAHEDVVIG